MDNPFADLKTKRETVEKSPVSEQPAVKVLDERRRQQRDTIYNTYSPLVNEVLDDLISAYKPGVWKQGSDFSHAYCCHINWFAGPEERYKVNYDEHHTIRRRIEVTLELDDLCNPVSFKVINHENSNHCVHVGLSKDALIRGVQEVFA